MKKFIIESKKRLAFDDSEKSDIKAVMSDTSFTLDEEENDVLVFSTRDNGNVSSQTHSNVDVRNAENAKSKILSAFPKFSVSIEPVDEWVMIFVTKEIEQEEYKYIFKKDLNGAGFSQSYDTMDELIKERKSWLKIDWKDVKKKAEAINTFPNDKFTQWMHSEPLQISKVGDEGNKWGYNFFIIKGKKK